MHRDRHLAWQLSFIMTYLHEIWLLVKTPCPRKVVPRGYKYVWQTTSCRGRWHSAVVEAQQPLQWVQRCTISIVEIAVNRAKITSVGEGSFEAVFPNIPPCIGVCYRTCLFDAALSLFSFLPLAPQDDIEWHLLLMATKTESGWMGFCWVCL